MQITPKAGRDTLVSVSTSTEKSHVAPKIVEAAPQSTVEGVPAAALQAPPKPEALKAPGEGDRLEQIARQERMLHKQREAFNAEKAKFEAERLKAPPTAQPVGMTKEQFIAEFRKDPASMGMSYDEMAQIYLAQGDPAQQKVRSLENKIAELEAKQTQALTKAEQDQKTAYANALKQIDHEATQLVNSNDAYEVTRTMGQQAAIAALIEETYKDEGVLMSVKDAADQVEEYLEKQALALVALNKIKQKTQPAAPTTSEAPQSTQSTGQKAPTTLTRALTQSVTGPLSAKDRRERAIAAFKGELK